jgi:hypothetical protein
MRGFRCRVVATADAGQGPDEIQVLFILLAGQALSHIFIAR